MCVGVCLSNTREHTANSGRTCAGLLSVRRNEVPSSLHATLSLSHTQTPISLSPSAGCCFEMAAEGCVERPLFGGAVSSAFPHRFQDLSDIRDVPDHQEAFADPNRDESIIFELLDLKHDVGDEGSAAWFLRDLAAEQDAESSMVVEHSSAVEAFPLSYNGIPSTITTAIGQMAISKGRQGREAGNIVRVYLANLRLKGVGSDVLITVYEPIVINPLSESARTVGAGPAVPAAQSGCLPASEVFKFAVMSFKVHDWNLFGAGA